MDSISKSFSRRFGTKSMAETEGLGKVKKPSLLPPRNGDTLWERATKFYLIPEGDFMRVWEEVMVFVAIVNAILVSFMAAFQYHSTAAWVVSYIIDILFVADMYIKFHIAYLVGGFWVVFPAEMALHYLRSWEFIFDVLINFPVDIVAFAYVGKSYGQTKLSLVRLWKYLRTGRIIIYFRRQESKLHASFRTQVVKFISYLVVLTHTVACIWFTIACSGEIDWPMDLTTSCSVESWMLKSRDIDFVDLGLGEVYIACIYWAVITMTTVGFGDVRANNASERVFAMFTAFCGIMFYGYINGTITSTLSNMDSRRVAYQQRLDAVKQYMTDRDMDPDMKERVLIYYDYVWERNRGIDVRGLFVDMPSTFKQEVALSLNNQIIDNAIIFKECSIGFRRMIAIDMKLFLFTANEYVVHRGDLGLEMFFITQGRIDIYATEDLRRPTASLIEGAYFGEFCVVLGSRHEYSARAVCNTDIYVFSKDDLEHAFQAYPEDREVVVAATKKRYQAHLQAKRSRGGAGATNRGMILDELEDLEQEFGVKGSVMKTDTPVRLAGDKAPSLRDLSQAPIGSRPLDEADLEGAVIPLEDDNKRKETKIKPANSGAGYALMDKTMAKALSQSSLSPARKAMARSTASIVDIGKSRQERKESTDSRSESSAAGVRSGSSRNQLSGAPQRESESPAPDHNPTGAPDGPGNM
ncbi:uncharacterized protein EV422DRAFT_575725 [Fimicolochytrium jonesii]|uniref:uncharacterized protein n=1 Tax=Fimicolochytrium jonesii TaxID=1396493 RepID=UPI0022FEC88F|nr:uncharacterized protein EV422DRAFT_575725 [Fimicolochytrium jonesii]KAI8825844.1 hypothetical protein EV422DRAFT_575725 [Fimicolochytrium jonesii]